MSFPQPGHPQPPLETQQQAAAPDQQQYVPQQVLPEAQPQPYVQSDPQPYFQGQAHAHGQPQTYGQPQLQAQPTYVPHTQSYAQQQSHVPQPYSQQQHYGQPQAAIHVQQQPQIQSLPIVAPARAPMGWYPVAGTSHIRWWDGDNWSAYRFRSEQPRADWFMTEPPMMGLIFGPIFVGLGLLHIASGSSGFGYGRFFNGTIFILVGCLWLIMAGCMSQVRAKPSPMTAQVLAPVVEPLPGRVEGPNAGWVAVSSRVNRWWSGARWGEYIFENGRVRPTHGGDRAYQRMKITAFVLIGAGILAAIAGFLMSAAMISLAVHWIASYLVIVGFALVLVGGIIFPVLYARRYSYVMPEYLPNYATMPPQY